MTTKQTINLNHILGCLLEITEPTEADLSRGGMSQEQIFLVIAEMSRGMRMFQIIQDALANVEPNDKTILIQKIIDERIQWACSVVASLRPAVN